jgi:hypothetical protein
MNPTVPRTTALLVLLAAALLTTACTAPSASEQDKPWRDAEDMVSSSDRIISARYLQGVLATVRESVDNAPGPESQLLYRQFQVIDTFKGTTEANDTLWVAFEPGAAGELVNGNGGVEEFAVGETYLLFLKGRLKPLYYPSEYGAVLWTGNGQPSIAQLEGEQLTFLAVRPYLSLLERENASRPAPESAAPFALTLPQLREMTD